MQLHRRYGPILHLYAREIVVGLAVLAVVAGVIALSWLPYRSANSGFGPDWDCTSPGHGEPVCVKRVAP